MILKKRMNILDVCINQIQYHTDQFQYHSPSNASANCISPQGIWDNHCTRFPLLVLSPCCCLQTCSHTQDNLGGDCNKWKGWPFPVPFLQGLFPSFHLISPAEQRTLCPGINCWVSSSTCHLPLPHTCLRYCSPLTELLWVRLVMPSGLFLLFCWHKPSVFCRDFKYFSKLLERIDFMSV